MKLLFAYLILALGQINATLDRPVVHLRPNTSVIADGFGGKLLELINAPATIYLPVSPPKLDSLGAPWGIDIRNLGPRNATVVDKGPFSVQINVGQTVHVYSNGTTYSLRR